MRTTNMLDKRVPHTKISMAFFGANDFIAIDLSHTGQMAKDLRIETHAANVPKAFMSMLTLNINWNGLTFKSVDGFCLKLPCSIKISILQLLKLNKVLSDLTEMQLLACTFGEYTEVHKWLLPNKPQANLCHTNYHNPALDAEAPNDN